MYSLKSEINTTDGRNSEIKTLQMAQYATHNTRLSAGIFYF